MNKFIKKAIAVVLCVTLLAGVLSVCAFAESKSVSYDYSGRRYKYYTYIGDSISWGYGLDSKLDPLAADSMFTRVDGSFTDIVGKTLEENCGTVICPAACNGARLCDFRMLLERGLGVENPYTYPDDTFGYRSIERTKKLQGSSEYVCENLKKSDLITVTLGANDMASCILNVAESLDFVDLTKLQSVNDIGSALNYVAFALSAARNQKHALADFKAALKSQIEGLKTNQKEVISDVVKLAPEDADIVVVGYFVPMDKFRLIKGADPSLLLELFGTVFTLFNDAYEDIASKYSNVYYVDAPDASIFFEDGTVLFDAITTVLKDKESFLLGIHPNADGHKYIAGKVIDALSEIGKSTQTQASTKLPMRTISYVANVIGSAVQKTKNNIKSAISSIFKR